MTRILIFSFLFFLFSCKNRTEVDISKINIEIQIKRFEQDLFSVDFDTITKEIPDLTKKYGEFFKVYNSNIIKIGSAKSPVYPEYLKIFLTDYTIYDAYNKCQETYPQVTDLNNKLTTAFKYYIYYLPGRKIPDICTFISGFNHSIVITEDFIGIGIDKYLGPDYESYKKLGIPKYKRYNMHKEKIVSDCMISWVITEFELDDSANTVLSNMLYHGKIMHFADLMLPNEPDTLKFGYTTEQLKWCINNEENMWNYLIENKHLFETNHIVINKYINNAPYTKFFTLESPGRAIVWLGREIIRSYIKHNSEITIEELMNENNSQKILTLSRYKP